MADDFNPRCVECGEPIDYDETEEISGNVVDHLHDKHGFFEDVL